MLQILFRLFAWVLLLIGIATFAFFALAPAKFDKQMNVVEPHDPYEISEAALALHATIPVADLHADTMLWNRDIRKRNNRGHVDLPRMREGGMFLQVFTAVTKSPEGQNYEQNETDTADNITKLALAQRWPSETWGSLEARAVHQAEKLQRFAEKSGATLQVVTTGNELRELINGFETEACADFRWSQKMALEKQLPDEDIAACSQVAGILGIEGSHALDGDLEAIDRLFETGYRLMGLHHFFDNKLGGSLHGTTGDGLSEFGRAAVKRMGELEIVIDVAHSSEQTVRDVLAMSNRPVVISHTGFEGHCSSPRNISDEVMADIAAGGGLIGVGFWSDVVCDASPAGIADAIIYGADKFGVDHVALGSDFDGTVGTELDASELPAITQALLDRGMAPVDIRKVMGGNTVRFFLNYLPGGQGTLPPPMPDALDLDETPGDDMPTLCEPDDEACLEAGGMSLGPQ